MENGRHWRALRSCGGLPNYIKEFWKVQIKTNPTLSLGTKVDRKNCSLLFYMALSSTG